jgi:BMFP domain-containing protein YqiC
MFNSQKFDEIAKKLTDMVPGRIKGLSDDLQKNFRSVLQSSFNKMDLVTREEFDVQAKVLAKTRAKVDELEQRIALLEVQLLAKVSGDSAKTSAKRSKKQTDIDDTGMIT